MNAPLLRVDGLSKTFAARNGLFGRSANRVHAVRQASFELSAGRTVGLVGESGSGKSTLARLVHRQLDADSGSVAFDGIDVTKAQGSLLKRFRKEVAFVFQDPYASLNPSWPVGRIVGEPLAIHGLASGAAREQIVERHLGEVGLDPSALDRRPSQFSGGQRQRIAIARALATEPRVLICDEPVSALDVSTRAQVLSILAELQESLSLAILLISHDLAVVQAMSDDVAVMYLGEIVEYGPAATIVTKPLHPYTVALVDASPDIRAPKDRSRIVLGTDAPTQTKVGPGCPFASRCPLVMDRCHEVRPPMVSFGGHRVACHLHETHMPKAGLTPVMPVVKAGP